METHREHAAGRLETPLPRRVLVVGLGRTGVSVARHFLERGVAVRATDRGPVGTDEPDLASVEHVAWEDPDAALADVDLVVPSPGVAASAPLLAHARARGVPVRSEIEVAARELDAPMVAVTGTNGKSTTTALVAHLLGGIPSGVFAGGNLGTPLIEALRHPWRIAVAEVSSFQLEWVETFRPRVGVLLNVTEDHLDRHGDIETYAAVKARLFARQGPDDFAVLNRDDARVARLAADGALAARVLGFGSAPADSTGAIPGAMLRGDRVEVSLPDRVASFSLERCPLLGAHNRENVMAAVLAAAAMGASDDEIGARLETFEPLPHRMQAVHERGGVRFVDDSKGTNVGALCRSLEGLPDGRVVLVAGGLDKGGDFGAARAAVARKARHVALYGRARDVLARSWSGAAPLSRHELFDEAVRAAAEAAVPGDVVLLSPACASFDQFENYAQRGDAFATLVRSLA